MTYPLYNHIGFKLVIAYALWQRLAISAAKLAASQEKVQVLKSIDAQLKNVGAVNKCVDDLKQLK